jgi:hypothetical protein
MTAHVLYLGTQGGMVKVSMTGSDRELTRQWLHTGDGSSSDWQERGEFEKVAHFVRRRY